MNIDYRLCSPFSGDDDFKKKNNSIRNELIKQANFECTRACASTSQEELTEILERLDDIEQKYVNKFCRGIMYPPPRPFKHHTEFVLEKFDAFVPEWYKIPVQINKNEKINGYELYDKLDDDIPWFRYDYFLKLEKLFNEQNTMDEEEFYTKYDEKVCTDWCKMDEHGECYGGFWKYPDGTEEKSNAWNLSREANGVALFRLPYSHALIFETISYGCNTRQECVRFSNFMCEYVKRKLANKPIEQDIKN